MLAQHPLYIFIILFIIHHSSLYLWHETSFWSVTVKYLITVRKDLKMYKLTPHRSINTMKKSIFYEPTYYEGAGSCDIITNFYICCEMHHWKHHNTSMNIAFHQRPTPSLNTAQWKVAIGKHYSQYHDISESLKQGYSQG